MSQTALRITPSPLAAAAPRYGVVVADADASSRRKVMDLIANEPEFELVAACASGREALDAVMRYRPQLIIADADAPGVDGFHMICEIRRELPEAAMPAVIFLTPHEAYTIRAFELRAVDCMLRPFGAERMSTALQRAKAFVRQQEMEDVQDRLHNILRILGDGAGEAAPREREEPDRIRRIGIRTGDRWSVIQASEIDWIGGAGVYANVAVGKETFLLRSSLTELERRLDPDRFVRIHRSTIVNITRVCEVRLHGHGEYLLVLADGTELRASRSYADRVREAIDKIG